MINTYKDVWNVIPFKERNSVIFLTFLILIMGILDALGVAAIVPFITILTDPEIIQNNQYIKSFYLYVGEPNLDRFYIIFGVVTLLFICISIPFKAYTQYLILKFTYRQEALLSSRLFKLYINKDYMDLIQNNTSDYETRILSEVGHIIAGALIPAMQIIMHTVIFVSVTTTLLLIDTYSAIIAFLIFGTSYSIFYFLLKNFLYSTGVKRQKYNKTRFNIASQTFLNIKIVKQKLNESFFSEKFQSTASKYANAITIQQVSTQLPRFFMEFVAFNGMIVIILMNIINGNSFINFLPLASALVFASYKLLPASQSIYANIAILRFNKNLVSKFAFEFRNTNDLEIEHITNYSTQFNFNKKIEFKNVYFKYPNSSIYALNNINLEIPLNHKVGIIGETGSGKSTLIDLLLGLSAPTNGEIIVDNEVLDKKTYFQWAKKIGFVPQKITLLDDSIKNNIAFGENEDLISFSDIKQAAKIAQIDKFIESKLSKSYDTKIGEDGVMLSGGQRQRIGLARAIYKNPSILVFDEATSALDKNTEKNIAEGIIESISNMTLFIVTHNVTTIKNCDIIFILDQGRIVDAGNYDYLKENSAIFNKLS